MLVDLTGSGAGCRILALGTKASDYR